MSVIMPMFRARYIGWLPLEGLIRQVNVPSEWELIIAEEQASEVFGISKVMAYRERLYSVGCIKVQYIPLKKWMPLGAKIKMMLKDVTPTSRIYVGHAADYYSSPHRLKRHYDAFRDEEVVIHLPSRALHCRVGGHRCLLQDTKYSKRKDHVIGRAIRMDMMQALPSNGPAHGVDGWMFRNIKANCSRLGIPFKIKWDTSDNWRRGLSTFGFNNISPLSGPRKSKSVKDKRYLTSYAISKVLIPEGIKLKLFEAAKNLKLHKHLGKKKKR